MTSLDLFSVLPSETGKKYRRSRHVTEKAGKRVPISKLASAQTYRVIRLV